MWKWGGYFFLFFSIFYYKIGKSDKYKYHRKKFIPRYVDGCKKTFAKAIAFCLNLCYNIHRKRAPMSVAPHKFGSRNKPPYVRVRRLFLLFSAVLYYKIRESNKHDYHCEEFFPRYVIHTITSPRLFEGSKRNLRSLLLRLKGSNRHRLVLLPLYAAFSLYRNVRNLSIPCCADGGIKKTFAKAIAFCLNLCYNIHRKRAPMSVAPLN